MTLTVNQQETLHVIVTGIPSGMLLKPIPSLVKRGLIIVDHVPNPGAGRPPFGYHQTALTRYRLTPLGLETYTNLRAKWHEEKSKSLTAEYQRDLQWARNKVVT